MRKRDEDHFVGGPWPHKSGGFEICYKKNGKKHSEYRQDLKEAELRCEYWKKTLAPGPSTDQGGEEHPVVYWNRILRESAELLIRDPENKAAAAAARALSSLAAEGLKCAKYLPPPPQKDIAGEEAIFADVDPSQMTTEELAALLEKN